MQNGMVRSGRESADCGRAAISSGALLDRLSFWLEGGGRGVATTALLDLSTIVSSDMFRRLAKAVVHFYAEPLSFTVRVGVEMSRWTRLVMWIFGTIARQSRIRDRGPGFEGYRVCQRLYRDERGRVHWDRYVWDDVRWERLFLARLRGRAGFVEETFVVYGLPVTLCFEAVVDEGALVLTLQRRGSSVLAWPLRVRYRTEATETGVLTRGDFRLPWLGLRVNTEFRAATSTTAGNLGTVGSRSEVRRPST